MIRDTNKENAGYADWFAMLRGEIILDLGYNLDTNNRAREFTEYAYEAGFSIGRIVDTLKELSQKHDGLANFFVPNGPDFNNPLTGMFISAYNDLVNAIDQAKPHPNKLVGSVVGRHVVNGVDYQIQVVMCPVDSGRMEEDNLKETNALNEEWPEAFNAIVGRKQVWDDDFWKNLAASKTNPIITDGN